MLPLDLSALASRLPTGPRVRFAPSPTGRLHLGHVASAVCVWGIARALGGQVLLRLEDHDRRRCRPEYETSLLDDLAWLGLEPDLGGTDGSSSGSVPCRQSDNDPAYEEALGRLRAAGLVFACDCSRRDLALEQGDTPDLESRYPGNCRTRGLEPGPGRGLRLRVDPGVERFDDGWMGSRRQDPSVQCGDLLVRDRLGQWTYQFAVVVDDLRQAIDLVVRGEDLVESTGRQILLRRLLGRSDPPVFVHHPLIRKGTGEKLSKAAGDSGIRDLRGAGLSPAAVLGRAAHLIGLMAEARDLDARHLASLFDRRPQRSS